MGATQYYIKSVFTSFCFFVAYLFYLLFIEISILLVPFTLTYYFFKKIIKLILSVERVVQEESVLSNPLIRRKYIVIGK